MRLGCRPRAATCHICGLLSGETSGSEPSAACGALQAAGKVWLRKVLSLEAAACGLTAVLSTATADACGGWKVFFWRSRETYRWNRAPEARNRDASAQATPAGGVLCRVFPMRAVKVTIRIKFAGPDRGRLNSCSGALAATAAGGAHARPLLLPQQLTSRLSRPSSYKNIFDFTWSSSSGSK